MGKNVLPFVDKNGVRKWLRFGRLNAKEFAVVRHRVDRLVSAQLAGDPPDRETTVWLNGVSDYVREKLAAAGLVDARRYHTLGPWLEEWLKKRTDLKPSSVLVYERCKSRLVEYFKKDCPLRSITAEDALDWRRWMQCDGRWKGRNKARKGKVLAENTVRKMTGVARQFFASALRAKLIEENPFVGLSAAVREVEERFHFVPRDVSLSILDACPDNEWKLIWTLLRWGGLRCPSEITALRLDGIDWEKGRLTVWSPKTEHHEGGECRIIPIFPEIRPHLEEAWEKAPDGAVYVIPKKKALRTHMERIIGWAGVTKWPKLFQNLRSTRETELAELYPIQVVVKWLGNSQAIARRHYLQVTDEHFDRALSAAPQKRLQSPPGGGGSEREAMETKNADDLEIS